MKAGDAYSTVVGPLGLATHIEKFGTVVGIGGGIGRRPCFPIATAIKEAGTGCSRSSGPGRRTS